MMFNVTLPSGFTIYLESVLSSLLFMFKFYYFILEKSLKFWSVVHKATFTAELLTVMVSHYLCSRNLFYLMMAPGPTRSDVGSLEMPKRS